MADWELIYQIIREADEGKFDDDKVNRHIGYANVYNYEDDKRILVFDTTDGYEYMDDILKERMEIPEDERRENPYTGWYIDYAVDGDEYVCFSDQGFLCSECDRWHMTEEYGYANCHIWDGEILCDECIKGDEGHMEAYIEDIMATYDNQDCSHANTILDKDELMSLGFERYNIEQYEHGWYGQMDDPSKIAKEIWTELGTETEIVFDCIKDYNPFATRFNVWIREVA